jgi:hypothetical protein
MQRLRHQQMMVQLESKAPTRAVMSTRLSRAERAHARLAWEARLARNVQTPGKGRVTITRFGVPDHVADVLGLRSASLVTPREDTRSLLGQVSLSERSLVASCLRFTSTSSSLLPLFLPFLLFSSSFVNFLALQAVGIPFARQ